MIKKTKINNETILKNEIVEKDVKIKYIFNILLLLGSISFLIVGLSSYFKHNIFSYLNADQIIFFPQGLTMCFYGLCGLIISINQFKIIVLRIGEGYNEFNKEKGTVKIFRKGLQNSEINITYLLTDIVRNIIYNNVL